MTSFKFPPPPPPPPKTSSNPNDTQQSHPPSQRGGFARGRGDGGHMRGGRGRGRGGANYSRGGHGRGGGRGGHMNSASSENYHGAANMQHMGEPMPPAMDSNALAQAVSFMATPAGQQAMSAFANHVATTGAATPFVSNPLASSPSFAQSPSHNATSQHAGQKRKWEDRGQRGSAHPHKPTQPKPQQQSSKPPRAKAAVAPPVPSFGFSLPTLPGPKKSAKGQKPDHKDSNNKKNKVRLGLTSQPPPEESSEEESGDEEAILGARIKGGGYAFEHEGQQISLQTQADVAAWIKDRRRNFPTQEKIIEKAEAAEARRRHELEFIRKLKGKPPRPEPNEPKPKTKSQKRTVQDAKKQEELAALRKRLHESMLKKRDAPSAVDLGLGYGSETESDESSVLSESSVVSSSEESEEDSDDDDDSDESDAPPEATSSKIAPPAIRVPPPAPVQNTAGVCHGFQKYGRCSRGKGCRFKHTAGDEKRLKRETLFEKMVEQELVKADQLALGAIKYLGQNGYLG